MGAVARANAAFGVKLAAMEVLEFATPAAFGSLVDELKASGGGMGWQPQMCVEVLRDDGEEESHGRPLFFLPTATGTARGFRALLASPAAASTAVRAWGLMDVGLAGNADGLHASFDELVGRRATRPQRPRRPQRPQRPVCIPCAVRR